MYSDFISKLDEKLELSEDVLDEESDINFDYDYKTSEADVNAKDVFDIHRSDSSYSTGLLPGSDEEDYYRDHKNKKGEIVYMTPEEYFEKCYNEPYVKHFYSDDDINKFKEKWEKHIVR